MNGKLPIGILLALVSLISACGSKKSTMEDVVAEMNYRAQLQNSISDIQDKDREVAKWQREDEEKKRQEKIKQIKQWIQGIWVWSGQLPVNGNMCMSATLEIVIDGDMITLYGNGKTFYNGRIKDINLEKGIISYGSSSHIYFNNSERLLFTKNGNNCYCFHKSASRKASESYEASQTKDRREKLMDEYNKLNKEGRQLMGVVERYYRTGHAGPETISAVIRLKQINDEKIRLAQQMGDSHLEAISRMQRTQSLLGLEQMGF